MLKVGFRDCRLRGGKPLGCGRTCSSLLTDTAFCVSVTCLWWGQPLAALLSGDGYKPTVKYATGTGMGNSLFHRAFKQTSCMQHISLYDALWGSLCLLSLPSGPDIHKES